MEFITEMEEVEEILQNHLANLPLSKLRERQLVQEMLPKLRDRQAISYAAIRANDKFHALEDEKQSLNSKCQHLREAMGRIVDPAQREMCQESLEELENTVHEFLENWDQVQTTNTQVSDALRALNQNLANLPNRIANPNSIALIQWPRHLCERLTSRTELAFEKFEYMTDLLNNIDTKETEVKNTLRGRRAGRKY